MIARYIHEHTKIRTLLHDKNAKTYVVNQTNFTLTLSQNMSLHH